MWCTDTHIGKTSYTHKYNLKKKDRARESGKGIKRTKREKNIKN